MNQKESITSRFIGIKLLATFFALAIGLLFFSDESLRFDRLLFYSIFPFLMFLFTNTRKKIEFDGKTFYLSNWKGKEVEVIPLEKISSMLFAGLQGNHGMLFNVLQAYRFFYFSKDGIKKEFWLFPTLRFSIPQLQHKIKAANPDVMILNDTFFIAHLLFRNEDWFR